MKSRALSPCCNYGLMTTLRNGASTFSLIIFQHGVVARSKNVAVYRSLALPSRKSGAQKLLEIDPVQIRLFTPHPPREIHLIFYTSNSTSVRPVSRECMPTASSVLMLEQLFISITPYNSTLLPWFPSSLLEAYHRSEPTKSAQNI